MEACSATFLRRSPTSASSTPPGRSLEPKAPPRPPPPPTAPAAVSSPTDGSPGLARDHDQSVEATDSEHPLRSGGCADDPKIGPLEAQPLARAGDDAEGGAVDECQPGE